LQSKLKIEENEWKNQKQLKILPTKRKSKQVTIFIYVHASQWERDQNITTITGIATFPPQN
jgi:hypothetical protein